MKPFAFLPISHKTPSFFPSIYLLIFIKLSRDLFFYFFWQQFLTTMSRIGLAFSGGGIRSAAFCSGVLRRLLQLKVKIENMSCVSGGGFTGTAYLDWKYRNGQKDNPKWHQEFFNQMRERTGYFCNWQSLVSWINSFLTWWQWRWQAPQINGRSLIIRLNARSSLNTRFCPSGR